MVDVDVRQFFDTLDHAHLQSLVQHRVRDGVVRATDGTEVPIRADTLCLHGDGTRAVEFARRIRKELAAAGVRVGAFKR